MLKSLRCVHTLLSAFVGWIMKNPREYFELKMTNNELTNDFVLEITDFTNADEANDLRELWESQVDTLRRTCGF